MDQKTWATVPNQEEASTVICALRLGSYRTNGDGDKLLLQTMYDALKQQKQKALFEGLLKDVLANTHSFSGHSW